MNRRWGTLLVVGIALVFCLLVERSLGWPVASVGLTVLVMSKVSEAERLMVGVIVGIVLGVVYIVPLSLSVALLFVCWWVWTTTRRWWPSQTLRLLAVSLAASGAMSLFHPAPTPILTWVGAVLSIVVVTLVSRWSWRAGRSTWEVRL